jgi:hypothetical protein
MKLKIPGVKAKYLWHITRRGFTVAAYYFLEPAGENPAGTQIHF